LKDYGLDSTLALLKNCRETSGSFFGAAFVGMIIGSPTGVMFELTIGFSTTSVTTLGATCTSPTINGTVAITVSL